MQATESAPVKGLSAGMPPPGSMHRILPFSRSRRWALPFSLCILPVRRSFPVPDRDVEQTIAAELEIAAVVVPARRGNPVDEDLLALRIDAAVARHEEAGDTVGPIPLPAVAPLLVRVVEVDEPIARSDPGIDGDAEQAISLAVQMVPERSRDRRGRPAAPPVEDSPFASDQQIAPLRGRQPGERGRRRDAAHDQLVDEPAGGFPAARPSAGARRPSNVTSMTHRTSRYFMVTIPVPVNFAAFNPSRGRRVYKGAIDNS